MKALVVETKDNPCLPWVRSLHLPDGNDHLAIHRACEKLFATVESPMFAIRIPGTVEVPDDLVIAVREYIQNRVAIPLSIDEFNGLISSV